jgi:hypothetical protein
MASMHGFGIRRKSPPPVERFPKVRLIGRERTVTARIDGFGCSQRHLRFESKARSAHRPTICNIEGIWPHCPARTEKEHHDDSHTDDSCGGSLAAAR